MKILTFIAILFATPALAQESPIQFQLKYAHGATVKPRAKRSGLLAYAERFIGRGNVTGFRGPWCGAFMGKIASATGHGKPRGFLQARQWLHAGPHVRPHVGAVAVLPHHVGIVSAVHGRTVTLLSGNHSHRVGFGNYPKRAILAFVDLGG